MATLVGNPHRPIPPIAAALLGAVVLALAVLLLGNAVARAAEPPAPRDTDLQLRARAALALAEAEASTGYAAARTPRVPAVAPMPRVAAKLPYPAAHRRAAADQLPLVVYVGCDGCPRVDGAVVTKSDSLGDVVPPAVVVAFPVGDRLHVDATIPGEDATPAKVQRAVNEAARKLEENPPKAMPAKKVLPAPLDYQIKADGPDVVAPCVCGDSCKCKPGTCPGKCPVAAKPEPKAVADATAASEVIRTNSGRLIRKVGNGYVYADEKEVSRPQATPFPPAPASIPTTFATGAVAPSTSSSGSFRPAGTFTLAPPVITRGSTSNCAPGEA